VSDFIGDEYEKPVVEKKGRISQVTAEPATKLGYSGND